MQRSGTHIYSPRLLPPKRTSWAQPPVDVNPINMLVKPEGGKKGFVSCVKHEGYTIMSHTLIQSITHLELGDISNIKHYYNSNLTVIQGIITNHIF